MKHHKKRKRKNVAKIKVVKNKVAPPFKTASVDIMYGQGISYEGELVDLAVEAEIIEKSGAWFSYKGNKIGQGKENAKTYLKNNPDLRDEIDNLVRDCYGIKTKEDKKKKTKKEETKSNDVKN